jgi:UDP-N-acetylmuramoylalanine--D-glutamate ligase
MAGSIESTNAPHAWAGRRVTLMGLGRHGGGVGAARFLAQYGAVVTVSEQAPSEALAESIAALADVPIHRWRFGGHRQYDFAGAELVVVNPAVRPDHPMLRVAREAGAAITSEIEIFLAASPARAIAVTGSNGKSTTASMLRDILAASGRRAWLGGNIGGSLLGELDRIADDDWVVLELSSFQLTHLSARARWPELAVVTNCTPNHLDWHGTLAEYAAAKRRLVEHARLAFLDPHDAVSRDWASRAREATRWAWPLDRVGPLAIPGCHNRRNAALAAAAAEAIGVDRAAIRRTLAGFTGLDHRLQLVGEVAGRRFYDDSKATSPDATIAALAALDGPLWLLAGGVSKGVPLDELAQAIAGRAQGAALFGASRDELAECLLRRDPAFRAHRCETMSAALAWCRAQSRPGDSIVLSPACASFDQFRDFEARGAAFAALVRGLASRATESIAAHH